MNSFNQQIVVMGRRVYEFVLAFPEPHPGFMEATEALGEQLARAQSLAIQQRQGMADSAAYSARWKAMPPVLRALFRPLTAVAKVAFRDQPEIARRFRSPMHQMKRAEALADARSMVVSAELVKDALLQHGLPEALLARLGEELDRLDALVRETGAAQRAYMSATDDLDVVATVILGLVRYLDGVNRYRYRNNPGRLAAWRSACRSRWTTGQGDGRNNPASALLPGRAPWLPRG